MFALKIGGLILAAGAALVPQVVFAEESSNYSVDGLKRYQDPGSGIYQYYHPSKVPGRAHEVFLFGTYSWSFPSVKGESKASEDFGYLVDCQSTQITKIFSALHISHESRIDLPDSLMMQLRKTGATRLLQIDGLETKNYKNHNELGQVVTYQDTSAFKLACGRDLTF